MPEPDIGLAILRGMRWVGAAVFLLALLLAWLLPTRRIHRMAALAGVEPSLEEPVAAYEQRQSSLRHSLAHAWTRYELAEK